MTGTAGEVRMISLVIFPDGNLSMDTVVFGYLQNFYKLCVGAVFRGLTKNKGQ